MSKYNFYTIHVDSLSPLTWTTAGSQSSFTSYLFTPLKNIVQVSILSSSFSVPSSSSSSNVVYLNVNQLSSTFNDNTGNPSSSLPGIISQPATKDKIRTSIARFNIPPTGRTIYNQVDFSTQTQFLTPIKKLDRLTCELFGENGVLIPSTSNNFISFRFTCLI